MRTLLALVLLAGCAEETTAPTNVGQIIVTDCGEAPKRPGWNVAREQVNGYDRVLMTPEIYAEIEAWRDEIEVWSDCVVSHP